MISKSSALLLAGAIVVFGLRAVHPTFISAQGTGPWTLKVEGKQNKAQAEAQ